MYITSLHRLRLLNILGATDEDDPILSTSFVHLGSMVYRYRQNRLWMVIVTFLASLKLFKYTKIGRAPRVLVDTLRYAAPPMIVFLMMFLLIISGFVMFFHSVYGTRVHSFSTVMLSTRSLLTSMVQALSGEHEHFQHVLEVPWNSNLLYPLLFVVFVIVCHFVLLNMFLAIMNDAHKVAHDIAAQTMDEYPPLSVNVLANALCLPSMARKCGGDSHDSDSDMEDMNEEEEDERGEGEEGDDEEKTPSELEEEQYEEKEDEEWRAAASVEKGEKGQPK